MAQLTYSLELAAGYEGQVSDSRPSQIDGRRNDSGAEIAFGKAVSKSSATDHLGMKLPAAGEVLLGILVNSQDFEKTATGLPDKDMGSVLSRGRVLVKVENAVAPGDGVLVRIDTGGSGRGSFRGGAAVAGQLVLVPQARFMTAAAANGLAEVDVNFPAVPTLA